VSGRVVLATCRHHPGLTASDELLATRLREQGAMPQAMPWDEIVASRVGDAVVCLRSTWDYHKRSGEFRAWIESLRAHDVTVVNSVATVLWNMDKQYLGWLEARGIAIPETRWIAPGESIVVPALLANAGWDRGVLKPRISATAYGTHLVTPESTLDDEAVLALRHAGALLQAFVPEIESAGEVSLVFVDGRFSHAARKQPAPGDFRVQHEFGGTVGLFDAPVALQEFGARVLSAIPVRWAYARVDLVDTTKGPLLMELELIEPDLFFTPGTDGARRLAMAICRPAPP
jgi:glutathione synthase/RimK-type ligase-like ATP-grasp enzyme